jgi:hypothetical protein
LCPGLQLAPFCWNWNKNGTEELAFLQDLELKTKPLLNTCLGSLGGQVDSFLRKLASRLNLMKYEFSLVVELFTYTKPCFNLL